MGPVRLQVCAGRWGDAESPVQLGPAWTGRLPPLGAPLRVASREACDADPLDVCDTAQALRLRAYVWADQPERLARLDAAIAIARSHPLPVAAEPAESWLPPRLAAQAPGRTTVLFHSVVWQYLPTSSKAMLRDAIAGAGDHATAQAPFAWLRFEPPREGGTMELRLTIWPGGRSRLLATAHPHGRDVAWLA